MTTPGGTRPTRSGRVDAAAAGDAAPRSAPPLDRPRQAAYEAVAAVHRDDAYANLVLPCILREDGLFGRDAAFATELTYGTLRAAGHAGRDPDRRGRPGRGPDRPAGPRRAAARARTNCCTPGCRRTPRSPRRWTWSVRSHRARPASPTRCCARSPAVTLDAWVAELAPPMETDPVGHLALAYSHPQWIVRAFAEALGGDLGETDPAADRGQRAPAGAPVRPARAGRPGRAGRRGRRRAGRLLAVRGLSARRRRRATCRRWPTAGPTSRTRVPSWWPPRWPRRRSRARTGAGWTCAPGRAARPGCSARWPRSAAPG